tara:strand:+ start:242067 stop:242924 length:858 start_codon:yes stop_codon:yes gene_type:complete
VPVVVIGNLTLGGTGKTPVVVALVEALQSRGLRPGVVSRGYGGKAGSYPVVVTNETSAQECGDEPLMIHRRTAAPCVVSPSRSDATRALLNDTSIDVVICDDGLQHYALARDYEVAVFDGARRWGNGHCLPAGPLREPLARMSSVEFVLWRNSAPGPSHFRSSVDSLVNLCTGERRPAVPASVGHNVHAVAGIGQPEQFLQSLQALGFTLQAQIFPDHHAYGAGDFVALADKPIIMTEKDAVKCSGLVSDNAWYLRISAELPLPLVDAVVDLSAKHSDRAKARES